MNEPFFSAIHIQILHVFLDTYIDHPSQQKVDELFAPIRPVSVPHNTHTLLTIARKENQNTEYLTHAWTLYSNSPYNPQFAKFLCEALYRCQHTKQDKIALLFIARILHKLLPEDKEAQDFVHTLSHSPPKSLFPWIILSLTICFFLFVYHQTSKRTFEYALPEITADTLKKPLIPTWNLQERKDILFLDQGSLVHKKEENVFSYLVLAQIKNQSDSTLVYMHGSINIYDQVDQRICTEPIVLLAEHHGPLFPNDDGYISAEIQCTTGEETTPYRAVVHIEQVDISVSLTPPEPQYVSSFPIAPITITKRFSSLTSIEKGYWLFNQFVIQNEDSTPKKNIRLRIHYYNKEGGFLAIEERHILKPNTNILPPKRHMLHSIGVRLQEPPHRMDIEIVDCE